MFVRVDFNVPMSPAGEVVDATRLEEALPTIRELTGPAPGCSSPRTAAGRKARRIRSTACGRWRRKLAELLGRPVRFAEDCVGAPAADAAAALAPGEVALLENLRFHAGETKNDPAFADQLAALAEAYVDDAFGAAHRAHASVVGVPERLPRKAAGRLMEREVAALSAGCSASRSGRSPLLLGGAKIEGKIATLETCCRGSTVLLLGGGMANTFLAAQGNDLAASLFEADGGHGARHPRAGAGAGIEVLLPTDVVVTDDLANPQRIETVAVDEIPAGTKAVDIGPATRQAFAAAIAQATHAVLERPAGCLREASVRRRHPRGGRRRWQAARASR